MSKKILLGFITIILIITGLLPVLFMITNSLYADGGFSTAAYKGLMNTSHHWALLGHSLLLAAIVTFFTLLIGVPLGFLFEKTDLPLKKGIFALFIVPILIPPYILAYSWFEILGINGLIASVSPDLTNVSSNFLFGLKGASLILFSIYLPITIGLTMISLKTVDPHMEEASLIVTPWRQTLKSITLPLISPYIILAGILVFLLTLGDFTVPNFLRYNVFTVESFTQFAAFYNFKSATAYTIPLTLIVLFIVGLLSLFIRKSSLNLHFLTFSNKKPLKIPLGGYKYPVLIAVLTLLFIIVLLPLFVLIFRTGSFSALLSAFKVASDSITRSLYYAFTGAAIVSVLGFFTAYLIRYKSIRFWRYVDVMILFLFALPSTVIGIGLILLWNRPATNLIYSTPIIIILGYIAKYILLSHRITLAGLVRIPDSMEEAAETHGANWLSRIFLIVVPIMEKSLVAAWLVGFIFFMRDSEITMVVYPPGHDTLSVSIQTLMANGSPSTISALSLIAILSSLIPATILWHLLIPRRK